MSLKGYDVRDTAAGFRAIRIHYSADPDRDPATEAGLKWYTAQRALYTNPNTWAVEQEINFDVGVGTRVFPEFTYEAHIRPLVPNLRKVVYRAWDFGWHAPVCLFAQIDAKSRLVLLKEIVGGQTTTREFAQDVIKQSAAWFPNHAAGFEDFCDPAGQQVKSVESEKNERRDTEVLNGLGIFPQYQWGWSRKDGRSLIHQLLNLRTDSTPSLWADADGCPTTSQAFLGQYTYPETKDGAVKDEPDDTTHPWADVMAAARYLVIGLHHKLGVARFNLAPATPFVNMHAAATHGYGSPVRGRR